MSDRDQERWDRRWSDAGPLYSPNTLLVDSTSLLKGGVALDLACGRGQNAIWLVQHGYHVLAVDISPVALSAARAQALALQVAQQVTFAAVDLDHWTPPEDAFDLIVVFRFLDRRLFLPIRRALRSGGLIFYSTRHLGALKRYPQANESYLLKTGELRSAFPDWQILHYEEGSVDAELIAKKPEVIEQ